jgi:hypothetical protein
LDFLKQVFATQNLDDSPGSLKPTEFRAARNIIPAEDGTANNGSKSNALGNTLRTNASLPSGTNTCIGSCEDREFDRVIYFIHNSSNLHSIFSYSPVTQAHTLIMQSSYLNFSLSYRITGCDVIKGILFFSDGLNEPRSFNIAQAIAGFYSTSSSDLNVQIAIYKAPPILPPTAARSNDAAFSSNNISADSWSFCTRFVYYDDEPSAFSPLSRLVLPNEFPKKTDANNRITVTQSIPSDVKDIIKKIQWGVVKNNSGEILIYKEEDATGASSVSSFFYNNEPTRVVDDLETSSVNLVPRTSKTLTIFKDRVFQTLDLYDFGDDEGDFVFNLALYNDVAGTRAFHLPGTSMTYGIIGFDRFGRTNGVIKEKSISIPNSYASSNTNADPSVLYNVQWGISGSAPSWWHSYSIVRKPNNTLQTWAQFPVQILFPKREDVTSGTGETIDNGVVYHNYKPNGWDDVLHLRFPDNIPININSDLKVRLLQDIGQFGRDTESVMLVKGNKLVTGNFGIQNWSAKTMVTLVQVESYREQSQELFFETGETYQVIDGSFTTTFWQVRGDAYRMSMTNTPGEVFQYENWDNGRDGALFGVNSELDPWPITSPGDRLTKAKYWSAVVYSQSPTTSSLVVETQEVSKEKPVVNKKKQRRRSLLGKIAGGVLFGGIGALAGGFLAKRKNDAEKEEVDVVTANVRRIYTFAYDKIAIDEGRPFIKIENKQESEEPTSIVYSEKLIQNSKINGLCTYTDSNVYQLSVKRTPVRKIQPAGEMLLTIHERDVTSLPIGQRISSSGEQDIITQTLEVIGDDRVLQGGHGTIHPQSVVEDNGRVWFFSAYTGELLRYNNGLTPLGMVYKYRTYLKQKGDQLLAATAGHVYAGFDAYLNILYVTFDIDGSRETIGFIDRAGYEGFLGVYDFEPEAYAKCRNKLYSFVGGQMYEHNANATRNNFYGIQYDSSITFLMNAEFNKNKILKTLAEESTHKWTVSSCTTPGGQSTRLHKPAWFVLQNGTYIAKEGWLRDENTNIALLSGNQIALRNGQEMEDKYFEITIENDSTEEVRIDAVTNGFKVSSGQRVN